MLTFICYPKCSTCKKAQDFLNNNGISYQIRNIKEDKLDATELEALYNKSNLQLKRFFNTSGLLYKSMSLKDKLPLMNEQEQLTLLSSDGMLVKRPLLVGDDFVLVGFKESDYAEKLNIK